MLWRTVRSREGVQQFVLKNSTFRRVCGEALAFTIGKSLIVYRSERAYRDVRLRRHEMEHIRQSRELGVFLGGVLYLLFGLLRGYQDNPFELKACEAEERGD